MGLIEKISRLVQRYNLAPRLLKALPLISLICYLAGIAWLCALPLDGQFRNTYVSENALLPHQASTFFRESEWFILRGFRNEIREFKNEPENLRNQKLAEIFDNVGLKTAVHKWTDEDTGEGTENLYAILHAPRGSHNEAIVLVAPWISSDGVNNDGGVALLVSLARYLRKWSVWHKNLIFVVPSNSHVALRKWVEAYHTSLKYTAGSIEGALVLEYPDEGDYFDSLEIFYDGLNGQLPNLDLINTAVKVADGEHLRTEILGMGASYHLYIQRLTTMVRGVFRQLVAGLQRGPGCEMFSGWRIDAITLRARGTTGPHDITTFGRVAESVTRSLNNLLEHFHQSFFFYLMLGPRYFVSIGTYLPSAMLVANSYPIMAIHKLLSLHNSQKTDIFPACAVFIVISALSLCLLWMLTAQRVDMLRYGVMVLAATVQCMLLQPLLSINAKKLLLGVSLILFGLFLTTLAMLNFSLALALGVAALPIAWISPGRRWNPFLVAASCPLIGLFALSGYMEIPFHDLVRDLVVGHKELNVSAWSVIVVVWLPLWFVGLVTA